MTDRKIDPFFVGIGEAFGVQPEQIRLKSTDIPGELTCIGPMPKLNPWPPDPVPITDIPGFGNLPTTPDYSEYCFRFVIPIPLPLDLCARWQSEYDGLRKQLDDLIDEGAWDEAQAVFQRLRELAGALYRCNNRNRVITYCIFPVEG